MSDKRSSVLLGYELGTGTDVEIPIRHLIVTGQTQEAGKTTALEALIARSKRTALAFVTKRGEGAFHDAHVTPPYFREEADWEYVASLLEASRGEKLKFERSWIIKASAGARTLADVHRKVKLALLTAKGINEGVYTVLDAYLEKVIPQIDRVEWAKRVQLKPGINVMDLTALSIEMQSLVIRASMLWILEHAGDTVVVVPEAWKFVPQGRGTPVKRAAESFIRQGAGLGNYLWLDSQDIAGVDKTTLKMVPVWILGVQREANEVARTLEQIPGNVKKPTKADIMELGLGQFVACWGKHTIKVYVRPAWMREANARAIAQGKLAINEVLFDRPTRKPLPAVKETPPPEDDVNAREEAALRNEIDRLTQANEALQQRVELLADAAPRRPARAAPTKTVDDVSFHANGDGIVPEELYQAIKTRLVAEAPRIVKLLAKRPELDVEVEIETITMDGSLPKGRVAKLIATGFFREPKTQGATRTELKRTGSDVNSGNLSRIFSDFVSSGFLTNEPDGYREVADMKVNIRKS